MILEHLTGRNVFSVFGGVPEFTVIREGKLRAQAAFAHAIVAGYGGGKSRFSLFVGLWWQGPKPGCSPGGRCGGTGYGGYRELRDAGRGLRCRDAGLCLWPFRRKMKMFRWGLLGCCSRCSW